MRKKAKRSGFDTYYFAESRDYLNVVEEEVKFFSTLIDKKGELSANFSVQQALKDVIHFLGDPNGRSLNVLVEFDVNDPRSQVPQTIYLGTKLCPSKTDTESQVTHSFCLADESTFLANIHLDRDFNPNATEKKPSTHIQMGGRLHPYLAAKGNKNCCWRDDVDKPRVPSLPVCSALLWHWAFLEYRDVQEITRIIKAWWWIKIVQNAEESILRPFFGDGIKLLNEKPQMGLLNAFYNSVPK